MTEGFTIQVLAFVGALTLAKYALFEIADFVQFIRKWRKMLSDGEQIRR
jgi:hypothetical protein